MGGGGSSRSRHSPGGCSAQHVAAPAPREAPLAAARMRRGARGGRRRAGAGAAPPPEVAVGEQPQPPGHLRARCPRGEVSPLEGF